MAYSGQRKLAFDAGFQDGLFQRPKDNPYDITTVAGSHAAYEEGWEEGQVSTNPPRGPIGLTGDTGQTGSTGAQGTAGADGNMHFVGNGAPAGGLGNDGDVYTDADTGDIYLKVTGSWSLQGDGGQMTLTLRTDTVDPAATPEITYRGDALPGVLTSAAAWRITRITIQSDGDIESVFADGNDNFDNIWNNRTGLSYS